MKEGPGFVAGQDVEPGSDCLAVNDLAGRFDTNAFGLSNRYGCTDA